jgi:ribose 5-phosphate isomerase
VVEHGLFLGMTDEVLLGAPDGRIETLPNQQGPRH